MKALWAILTCLLLLCCASCGAPTKLAAPDTSGERRIKIVATYTVLGDFAKNVARDAADVFVLVGPGIDPHTFEPSPRDAAELSDADLILENGLGFEAWLEKLITASRTSARRIVVSDGLAPLTLQEDGRTETDPHIWHDVMNAEHMVKAVEHALVEFDVAKAAKFHANAAGYLKQLDDLDAWVVSEVKRLPAERRKLVTSHDTFGYFAKRYGFTVIATAFGSVSTEAADPAAHNIAMLIEQVKQAKVPSVFAESTSNPKLMQRIAGEAGVSLAPMLFTDSLGQPGSVGDTYIKMMHYNVAAIVKALLK